MNTVDAIMARRSIRKYTDMPVDNQTIQTILKAGMQAPSGNNKQPWYFVIIDDRDILDDIPRFHSSSKMLKEAPMAILVCGDTSLEKRLDYINQDCAAATQNILLAAHDVGLGAVWLGIHPNKERVEGIRELLKLPDGIIPISLISLGYPAVKPEAEDRFRPEHVYRNSWKNVMNADR